MARWQRVRQNMTGRHPCKNAAGHAVTKYQGGSSTAEGSSTPPAAIQRSAKGTGSVIRIRKAISLVLHADGKAPTLPLKDASPCALSGTLAVSTRTELPPFVAPLTL